MKGFSKIKKLPLKIYRFFISLKLAVFVLSSWAVLTGIGTFVESRYDQEIANKLVYDSLWMRLTLLFLALNLLMVLIDRWPWKKRHTAFVLAHTGILILMLGSFFTARFGVDGSLRFEEGEKSSSVSVSDMEIKIYSSYSGEKFRLIYEQPVDLFSLRPTEEKPHVIQAGGKEFVIDRFLPFAVGRKVFQKAEKGGGPAVRFHLKGAQASLVEWINLPVGQSTTSEQFGPANISLTTDKHYKAKKNKELVLFSDGKKLFYKLSRGRKKPLKPGRPFSTGWMDFQFRLLEFLPLAQKLFVFEGRDRPSDVTVKAVHIRYGGNSVWMGQNSHVRFFDEDQMYAVAYLNKTYDLGFDLELLDFRMQNYEGSAKAKSYESEVRLNDEKIVISMNEPLKYGGWTFYQSSFESSPDGGDPVVSILSVNRDPGRALKYAGSALVVMGIIWLFYRRRI